MLAKQDAMECSQHKKLLEAYCEACQELLCFKCTTQLHFHHRVQMVEDIIDNCKKEVKEGICPLKQQIATVIDTIKDLDSCDEAIARQGDAI